MTEGRPERADAARNRRAILNAAERLLTQFPPHRVSVERIAAEAGVGKGTVFHRFGSRAGLMRDLMLERALALREAVTDGPPPLGPGAPARERLFAFVDAVVEVAGRNKGLLATLGRDAAAIGGSEEDARKQESVYGFWHDHLSRLIAEERPDLDAELLAHALLATLGHGPVVRLLSEGGAARVAAVLRGLAEGALDGTADVRAPSHAATRQE
ncbi:helix-turn-helix domain-containing protein [Streptomyces mobaraensis]|uniref:TetR/AcrR family transcriptional regulator n=1 Tax=Streptomyces mobaraensis TaxID=35621 RepID=UPI00333120E7